MSDTIIVAIITGVCAIVGNLIISNRQKNELYARLDKQSELADAKLEARLERYQAVTDTKIEALTVETRKHNSFGERIPVLEEKVKFASNRIADLEKTLQK